MKYTLIGFATGVVATLVTLYIVLARVIGGTVSDWVAKLK